MAKRKPIGIPPKAKPRLTAQPLDRRHVVCYVEGGVLRDLHSDLDLVITIIDEDDQSHDPFKISRPRPEPMKRLSLEHLKWVVATEKALPYGHLTKLQRHQIRKLAIEELVSDVSFGHESEYEDYIDYLTTQEQLELISGDTQVRTDLLGFDPEEGRPRLKCRDCDHTAVEEEFLPSDGRPEFFGCPKCGKSDCFPEAL